MDSEFARKGDRMKLPKILRKEKPEITTPFTWEAPYKETRTVKTLSFYDDSDKDEWVKLIFDCKESWVICLNQYKRLGKPTPGDKIVIRLSNQITKGVD